jgi:hypothetical protein
LLPDSRARTADAAASLGVLWIAILQAKRSRSAHVVLRE